MSKFRIYSATFMIDVAAGGGLGFVTFNVNNNNNNFLLKSIYWDLKLRQH